MKTFLRILAGTGLVAGLALLSGDAAAGRFGGGGGGGRGGGGGFGGGYGPAPVARPAPAPRAGGSFQSNPIQSGTVHGAYGGTISGGRQTGTVTGAGGGSGVVGRQGGAYTGPRGGQAVGGARAGTGTTAGGATVSGGSRGGVYTGPRGGVVVHGGKAGTVTGPAGNTVSGGKTGTVVMGPNGNVHASGTGGVKATGPGGTAASVSHGSVTAGPGGAVATGGRVTAATGAGGTVASASRGAVAVGPYGAAATGGRVAAGTGAAGTVRYGTRYVGAATLPAQGIHVRQNFGYYNAFRPGWYARYPGAWYAAGLATAAVWNAATWGSCSSSCGYSEDTAPVSYEYGDNVTYQDGNVYYGDQVAATESEYADQASQIADTGKQAKPPEDEKWEPLGVFAMVKGEETTSNDIFQLALNKNGVLRGNYYNAVSDTTTPVYGSLDKKTQRVAWTIADKKEPVYETGLYNLTQEQTTMLVHVSKDATEQCSLFRVEQPKEDKPEQPK